MKLQSANPSTAIHREEQAAANGTGLILFLITLVLGLTIGFSIYKPARDWAKDAEKYWGNFSTLVTTGSTVAGLWFVWLKFIRARDFASKVEISFTSAKFPLEDNTGNIHAINIKIENKGTVAIKKYELEPILYFHKKSISSTPVPQTPHLFLDESGKKQHTADAKVLILDVGAYSFAHYVIQAATHDADAITFGIKMKCNNDDVEWQNFVTISNTTSLAARAPVSPE
jgi:hypothetical protein